MVRRLLVDSRYRHLDEEPNRFSVVFCDAIRDGTSIALLASHAEFTGETVSAGSDTLEVDRGQGFETFRLRHGRLTTTNDLLVVLNESLPDGVEAQEDDGHVAVLSSVPFSIRAGPSASVMMGLRPYLSSGYAGNAQPNSNATESIHDGTGQARIRFPYPPNFSGEPYLLLRCSEGGAVESPVGESDGITSVLLPGIVDVAQPIYAPLSHRLLSRLHITITRPGGEDYDFRGNNVRLEFAVK